MSWAETVLARREIWGRAPSAHNTQPWTLTGAGERLLLGWDESRHLRTGDPTRRDLMLGLGCLAEALAITSSDLGHPCAIDWDIDVPSRRAAVLRRDEAAPAPESTPDELVSRRTARAAYREPFPNAEDVAALGLEICGAGPARLEPVPAPWVSAWLPVADEWALVGPAAEELAGWLRLSPRHPRHRLDGLSAEALGLSGIEAALFGLAMSRPGRGVLRGLHLSEMLASRATARPLGTVVALIAPDTPDLGAQGELGRLLLRCWLAAGRRGWSVHPLSALLDCPESLAAWPQDSMGLDRGAGGDRPYAVFRMGTPTEPPPASARLGAG